MDLDTFPTVDEMDADDWRSVFESSEAEWRYVGRDGVSALTAQYASPAMVLEVVHFDGSTNEGGTELNLNAVMVFADGSWAWVTAWNDYTGWGCQEGVSWVLAPDRDTMERFGIDDATRRLFGIGGYVPPDHAEDAYPYDVNEAIISINWRVGDVLGMAEEAGVEPAVALERARSWAKGITDTANGLIGEQLSDAVGRDQP